MLFLTLHLVLVFSAHQPLDCEFSLPPNICFISGYFPNPILAEHSSHTPPRKLCKRRISTSLRHPQTPSGPDPPHPTGLWKRGAAPQAPLAPGGFPASFLALHSQQITKPAQEDCVSAEERVLLRSITSAGFTDSP